MSGAISFEDVRHVTADDLRARLGCLPDVVVGSPPCQDASVANHAGRGIDGARTGLFGEWIRIVSELRPVWCAAENVPGLRTRGLERVVAALGAEGYRVDVLDVGAENLGAPHRRRRLWIIGTRRDIADAQSAGCEGPGSSGEAAGVRRQSANADCKASSDADPPALRQQQGWQRGARRPADAAEPGDHDQAIAATDADQGRQQALGRSASRGSRGADAHRDDAVGSGAGADLGADTDETRLALDPREPGHDGAQQPAAVGVDWLDAWTSWNGGCARHLELVDGIGPAVARPLVAAIGDAVCPAIPEAIGRVMMELAGGETFIDLFSGAVGGWSIGLEAAGMRCLAYAEADPWRRRMYAACRANDGAGMGATNMPPARSAAA